MADYKAMYYRLFAAQTKAIEALQAAQQQTEQMYLAQQEPVTLADIRQAPAQDTTFLAQPCITGGKTADTSLKPTTIKGEKK